MRVCLSALLVLALWLSGCGFHLRSKADLPFATLYVATVSYSPFAEDVKRAIRAGSSVQVVDQAQQAQATLSILAVSKEKLILSLSGGGKVREYQLRYKVAYRLQDASGKDLMASGEISLKRDLIYDDNQVLAKESEEVLLYRDMQGDAVQQLLRRLAAVRVAA